MSPSNVNDLIGEVLALVHGELESHQISFCKLRLRDGLPPVLAERVATAASDSQLVTNAIEATSSVADRERVLVYDRDFDGPDHVLIISGKLGHRN